MKIKIVIATRASELDFFKTTATGRSLAFNKKVAERSLDKDGKRIVLEVRLFPNNTKGLPTLYNQAIRESINDPSIIIFAHDDIHILDYFWIQRLIEGLTHFNVLGLAGNLRRVPRQPSWAFIDTNFTWDAPENLSGIMASGKNFPPSNPPSFYGPPRQKVMLLDGLLLASDSKTLIENNLFFDERFQFHFYDLDFCRQAELKNVSCGTWDLSLMHESGGSFGSVGWNSSYQEYLNKWGD